jgi:hypothetical protein
MMGLVHSKSGGTNTSTAPLEARVVDDVELRRYGRKGMSFLGFWEAELPSYVPGTDAGNGTIAGVLLE